MSVQGTKEHSGDIYHCPAELAAVVVVVAAAAAAVAAGGGSTGAALLHDQVLDRTS